MMVEHDTERIAADGLKADGLAAESAGETIALSPQQARLLRLGASGETLYQGTFRIAGALPVGELQSALDTVVEAQEILRTVYRVGADGEPQAVLRSGSRPHLAVEDLGGVEAAEQERRTAEILAEHRRSFDLAEGPLLRLHLLHLAPEGHLLLISLHGLCGDRAGLENLLRTWGAAWDAHRRGQAFEDEGLQYGAVAEWQQGLLQEEDAAVGRGYWREQLLVAEPELELLLETPGPAEDGSEAPRECLAWALGEEVDQAVQGLARNLGTSPEVVLAAAWGALLLRLSTALGVALGRLVDGRSYEDLEGLLGPFARRVPLALSGGGSFGDLVEQVAETWEEGDSWQEYFEGRNAAGDEVCFAVGFEAAEILREVPFGPLVARREGRVERPEPSGLHLGALRQGRDGGDSRLSLELTVDGKRFEASALACLRRQFETLLAQAVAAEDTSLADLELLSAAERGQLMAAHEPPVEPALGWSSLAPLILAQAGQTPHRVAAICHHHHLSYGALAARAAGLARILRARGVGVDTPVGLFLERGVEVLVGMLGILSAGGAYVPLDPASPAARWSEPLARAGVSLWVSGERERQGLPESVGEVICLEDGAQVEVEVEPPLASDSPAAGEADGLAYVILTSGSTGMPKGVGITQRNLLNYVTFVLAELGLQPVDAGPGRSFATVSTFAADLGNTVVFPSLACGGTLHVLGAELAMDADRFTGYLRQRPVDVLKIVPSHFRALFATGGTDVVPRQVLFLGGEELRADLVKEIAAAAPQCVLINHYGPTESTVGALRHRLPSGAGTGGGGVPIGSPIPGGRALLLDRCGRPVAAGEVGELYLGGVGVARGYPGCPGQTAERFLPDPGGAVAGARVYRTGDLACRQADGLVRFLGRTDHQVKLRGYRVEPGEIESILRRVPGVRQSAVVVAEEGGRRWLVAYLESEDAAQPPAVEGARDFLAEHLPEYMVPASWVVLERLPLTSNGKLDRASLPRPGSSQKTAPATPVEAALAAIWCRVLGLEEVGTEENFFELGGDSILSIQIVARARQEGMELNPRQIFEHPTVAELAGQVGLAPAISTEQGEVVGEATLTPVMHRFFDLMATAEEGANPAHYNMSLLLELLRPVSPAYLEAAVRALLRHHDALRLRFERAADGSWAGRFASLKEVLAGPLATTFVDLSALPPELREGALEAAADAGQRSLDLARGPLLRAVHFDLAPAPAPAPAPAQTGRLLLVLHHLVVDGVSWQILLEDLASMIHASERAEGEGLSSPVLPPKSTSFKAWGAALAAYAAWPEAQEESDFWQGMGGRATRPIPLDHAGGSNREGDARTVSLEIDEGLSQRLLHDLPTLRAVRFDEILLGALARAVCRFTGGRAVLLELEGHGREEEPVGGIDLSRTVGWFTTHFPVLLDLGRAVTPAQTLRVVKEQLRRLPHRGLGYGVQRWLAAGGSALAGMEAPQIGWNYLGQQDRGLPRSDLLAPTGQSSGDERSPRVPRKHVLGVHATVLGGQLKSYWTYSARLHRETTIERLAGYFREALEEFADGGEEEPAVASPVDFPDLDLDQDELDSILGQLQ